MTILGKGFADKSVAGEEWAEKDEKLKHKNSHFNLQVYERFFQS